MKSSEQMLYFLKTHGAQTAQRLAELRELTSTGARRQLEAAHGRGLVQFDDVADKVGRPARLWQLTSADMRASRTAMPT